MKIVTIAVKFVFNIRIIVSFALNFHIENYYFISVNVIINILMMDLIQNVKNVTLHAWNVTKHTNVPLVIILDK